MNQDILNDAVKRKKLSIDAATLRERVSRDTETIIKMGVAERTKITELTEQLNQSETNYEKTKQNMAEVQMKQEDTMAQYQQEIRRRPETLNKVKEVDEMYSTLEKQSARLIETLKQCKADQVELRTAYHNYGGKVKELKKQMLQKEEELLLVCVNAQEKLKLQDDCRKDMQQYFESTKQHITNKVEDLMKVKLTTANAQKDESANKQEYDKKEERISNIQNKMQQLIREYTSHNNNTKDVMTEQENELKESREEIDFLKKALENRDRYRKGVCDENKLLREKLSTLEEENKDQRNMIIELEDATMTTNTIERDAALPVQNTKDLKKTTVNYDEHINNIEMKSLKSTTSTLEAENAKLLVDVNSKAEESKGKIDKLAETIAICKDFEVKVQIMKSDKKNYIEEFEANIKELQNTIQLKDKELNSNSALINKLMSDIKEGSDAESKLNMALESVKHECEMEKKVRQRNETTIALYKEHLKNTPLIVMTQSSPPPDMGKIDKMTVNLVSEDSTKGDSADSASKPPMTLRQRNRVPTRSDKPQSATKGRSTDITGFTLDRQTKKRKFF